MNNLPTDGQAIEAETKRNTILLFVITAVVLWCNLGSPPVYILDEARNAQAAREMMQRNDFIVPTFNAELRPHKPPLHYYFMRAGYEILGANAWGARFFSALMGWLTIYVTWFFVKRFTDRQTGFITALILACSTHFLFEFRLAVPDPYLIFFITAGLFTFYAYVVEKKWKWFVLSAASLALASLAKGPVALALPGLSAAVWLVWEKNWKTLFSWRWLLYALLVVAIAAPWYLAVHYATRGEFTRGFFLEHNLNRFGEAMEGHGGIFLLVPLFVLVGLLPVSVFVGEVWRKRKLLSSQRLVTFSACVVAAFIIFFSLSRTKLPNYPMPCYSFAAFLFGYWIKETISRNESIKTYPFVILLALNVAILAGGIVGIHLEPALRGMDAWVLILVIPLVASVIALYYRRKNRQVAALRIIAMGYIFFNLLFLGLLYPVIYAKNPVSKMLPLLNRADTVYAYKIYNPAFNFYLDKPVVVLHDTNQLREQLRATPQIRVLTRESELPELAGLSLVELGKGHDIFEIPVTVVLGPK